MGTEKLGILIDIAIDGQNDVKQLKTEFQGLKKSLGGVGPSLDETTKKTNKLGAAFSKLASGGALLAVGAGLLALGKASITAASDVEEMQSKFDVVFKDLGGETTAELQKFADAANRSIFDLQGFAATLQDTFVPLGFARDKAAEMSVEVVKLVENLASFNNIDSADVLLDVQSALVGNTETLRKYGTVATQAAIDQEALALGFEFTAGKMDAQTKASAILSILTKSTTDAQGDAIRTSESFANQMKGLEAATSELLVTLGNELLPVASDVVGVLSQLAKSTTIAAKSLSGAGDSANKIGEELRNVEPGAAGIVKRMQDVAIIVNEVGQTFGITSSRLEKNTTAMTLARKAADGLVEEEAALAMETLRLSSNVTIANEALQKGTGIRTFHADAITESNKAMAEAAEARRFETKSLISTQNAYRDLTGAVDISSEALQKGAGSTSFNKDAIEAHKQALIDDKNAILAAEQAQAGFFKQSLQTTGAIGFFNESAKEMADSSIFVSNLTGDQSRVLGDLRDEYDKIASSVQDYQFGVEGLGLTEEERAAKIGILNEQMGSLQAAMEPLISTGGDYVNVAGAMTINEDALNSAIFESAAAAGASASELAILGGALGLYSDEAVEAALKSAIIQGKIDELAIKYAAGAISVADMRTELFQFIGAINEIPELKEFTLRINQEGEVNIPGANVPSMAEFNAHGTGGIKTVPSGFPNDTYPMFMTSGEQYAVSPAGQSLDVGNSAPSITLNINVAPGTDAATFGNAARDSVSQALADAGIRGYS